MIQAPITPPQGTNAALVSQPWLPARRRRFQMPAFDYKFTGEGTFFIVLMALIGFAAWHSGTNLLYLMFSMLIGFFLVQGLLVWRNLRTLNATRELPRELYAGVPVHFTVRMTKRGRSASYALNIADIINGYGEYASGYAPRVRPEVETRVACVGRFPSRGIYVLQALRITTRFPFGFIERSKRVRSPEEVLVYPFIANTGAVIPGIGHDTGELETRTKGPGIDFHGLREYRPGEHTRRIHWRSTARAGRLMLMEFDREEQRRVVLVLDNGRPPEGSDLSAWESNFEMAVSLTASIAVRLITDGYEVAFMSRSGEVFHAGGSEQLHRILRTLACIRADEDHAAPLLPDDDDSMVVYVHTGSASVSPTERREVVNADEWRLESGEFAPKAAA